MSRPLGLLLLIAGVASGCRDRGEVVVFFDQALSGPLSEVAERLRAESPGLRVRLEPSDPALTLRKPAELGLEADLLVVGEEARFAGLRGAKTVAWTLSFATDEVVVAHKDHSRFTDEISTANWTEVLQRPGVSLGCAEPWTSPVGAHAALSWDLAGQQALNSRCARERTVPGETELIALLESRAVDYVFLHRSTAEGHHLKVTPLRPEWNLGRLELAGAYATASLRRGDAEVRGGPLACALAVPEAARNREGAFRVARALLAEAGRKALERAGYRPLVPAVATAPEALPSALRALVAPAP